MPSLAFTELSSLFSSKRSTKGISLSLSLEEYIILSSNLDVNLCLDKTCVSIVPSPVSSDLMNSDLTSKLITDDLLVSRNIFKILTIGQYGITVGPTETLNQDNLLGMQESKGSQKQLKVPKDFKLNLQSHPETVYSNDLNKTLHCMWTQISDVSEATSTLA